MKPLRVGVVGVGHLGSRHADIYRRLPGVELVATADVDPKRGATFASHRDLLERVDAVSVAVPTVHHYAVAKDFLSRGIPTLVEKPLAKTLDEAEALTKLAREKGAILQVGHVERFNPAVTAIQDVIRRPRFVECHRLGQFSFRSTDIDVVLDLMIHDIDIVLHLVDAPLRRVDAVGVSLLFGSEDLANARLEFENGCVANVTASRISVAPMRKIRVFSEDSYVSLDLMERSARIYRKTEALQAALAKIGPVAVPTPEMLASLPKEFYDIREVRYEDAQPLEEELKHFVAAARDKRESAVPGEHGVRAMKVAEQVLKEVRGHTWR